MDVDAIITDTTADGGIEDAGTAAKATDAAVNLVQLLVTCSLRMGS